MKLTSLTLLLLLLTLSLSTAPTFAQSSGFHVTRIEPYDKAVPGQIMELLVEGLEGGASPLILPVEDFKLTVLQDGVSQDAKIRTVSAILRSDPRPMDDARAQAIPGGLKMRSFQSVNFVVPRGLHPGEAELTLFYRGERANAIGLTIVEKPLRPRVGSVPVMTISTSSLPPPSAASIQEHNLGWRLERGATARLSVTPLTDPDDPNSAVVVRFKQGEVYYDAQTRVTNQPFRVENRNRGVGFFPARDFLEVDVPAALTMGPVEVEVRLRANGQIGEATKLSATIIDSARSAEAPTENAPRLLMVAPTRVGAGQSMILSLDYRRTLDPDPAKTVIVIEQGTARYIVPVEKSSLKFGPRETDAPVLFFVRTTKEIIGKAQIRIFNQLRGQQTGMSEPVAIEILDEPLPPDLLSVSESTAADLAPLRQRYEIQTRAGAAFPEFDPQRKYITIHVKGLDYNPNFVRVTLEQEGRSFMLRPVDFSSYLNDTLIVLQPKQLKAGPVKITIENRGADSFSVPVSKTFEICCIH